MRTQVHLSTLASAMQSRAEEEGVDQIRKIKEKMNTGRKES